MDKPRPIEEIVTKTIQYTKTTWSCGIDSHNHVGQAEAQKCINVHKQFQGGQGIEDIAKHLGMSKEMVKYYLKDTIRENIDKQKREKQKRSSERRNSIKLMREEGNTYKKIGEKFGISATQARGIHQRECRAIAWKEHIRNNTELNQTDNIHELDLSVRAHNGLRNGGITTVSQFNSLSDKDLMKIQNFGKKTIAEIRQKIQLMSNGVN